MVLGKKNFLLSLIFRYNLTFGALVNKLNNVLCQVLLKWPGGSLEEEKM